MHLFESPAGAVIATATLAPKVASSYVNMKVSASNQKDMVPIKSMVRGSSGTRVIVCQLTPVPYLLLPLQMALTQQPPPAVPSPIAVAPATPAVPAAGSTASEAPAAAAGGGRDEIDELDEYLSTLG